jgi:RNA polymerase-binding transcription factor DksA
VAEARRLGLLHDAITGDITAGQIEADGSAASDTRGPTAAALTLEHEVEESLRVAIDDERAEVAFALARLDTGTYGACVACGETIPDVRLAVVPATRFCIGCEVTGERGARAADLPLIDTILRAALREVDGWADDGPDEDDVVVPAPEEDAMHDATASGRA